MSTIAKEPVHIGEMTSANLLGDDLKSIRMIVIDFPVPIVI